MILKKDTKQILIESLLQLSRSKPIEEITVVSIVENCGMGRQTFYNHFTDKYDLINWFYTSNANKIFMQYNGSEPWGIVLGYSLAFMYQYRDFFKKAINEESQLSFFHSLYEYTQHFYIRYIKDKYGNGYLTDDLIFDIRFNSYGAANMAREWFKNGMKELPETVGIRIANAMPQSLKKFFNNSAP